MTKTSDINQDRFSWGCRWLHRELRKAAPKFDGNVSFFGPGSKKAMKTGFPWHMTLEEPSVVHQRVAPRCKEIREMAKTPAELLHRVLLAMEVHGWIPHRGN